MEEENEVEASTNPIADLVQHSLDQDYNKANKIFGDILGARLNDALDQEKIKIADQLYNGEEDVPEEGDDEQLELDLASEEGEEDTEVEEDDSEEEESEEEFEEES